MEYSTSLIFLLSNSQPFPLSLTFYIDIHICFAPQKYDIVILYESVFSARFIPEDSSAVVD